MKRGLKPNQIRRNEYIKKLQETESFKQFLSTGQLTLNDEEYKKLKSECVEQWDVPKPSGFFGNWSFSKVSEEYFRKSLKDSGISIEVNDHGKSIR